MLLLIDYYGIVGKNSILADWPFPPQKIDDPAQTKPAEWVDEEMIPDPEDIKPAGWDDIPEQIPDPDAEKPEDWSDEDDGEVGHHNIYVLFYNMIEYSTNLMLLLMNNIIGC